MLDRLAKQQASVVLVLCLLAVGTIVLNQNCAQSPPSEAPITNHPSPFKDPRIANGGISLSPNLLKQLGSKTQVMSKVETDLVIATGTKLVFIVDDICISKRVNGSLDRYFLDAYLNPQMELAVDKPFHQSMVTVSLPADLTFSNLVKIKRADSCIEAIADDQGIQYKISQTAGTDPQRTKQWYLDTTHFDPNYFATNTNPGSVTVAVIDSGYDFTGSDPIATVDPAFMIGSNSFNGTSNPQDDLGHGTSVTALIADKIGDGRGLVGLASPVAKILPLRVLGKARTALEKDAVVEMKDLFHAMKQAVNAGADVMNISLGATRGLDPDKRTPGMPISCDPVFGQSLYEAVQNGVFVVIAAGNATHQIVVNGQTVDVPGPIYAPKDNSSDNLYEYNDVPACWARYYKGVVAVSSVTQTGDLGVHTNWGKDAVEISAPGEGILTQTLGGAFATVNGTSFATPMVSAAVANIIGFYKKHGWSYNPWTIEDTLINGSLSSSKLTNVVRLGKTIDFASLKNYLTLMTTWTDEQRREQPSDNPEAGVVFNGSMVTLTRTPIKLEVYTREEFVNVNDQAQMQAVLYYSDATAEVVSDKVQWSTSDSTGLPIVASGMLYPSRAGTYSITGVYQGRTASANVIVTNVNTWTGSTGKLMSLDVKVNDWSGVILESSVGTGGLNVTATYTDGRVRVVHDMTVFAVRDDGDGNSYVLNENVYTYGGKAFWLGGSHYKIVVMYRGLRADVDFQMPTWSLAQTLTMQNPATRLADNYYDCDGLLKFDNNGEPEIAKLSVSRNTVFFLEPPAVTVNSPEFVFVEGDAIAPSTKSPSSGLIFCDRTDWGQGVANKLHSETAFTVVDAKPLGIRFHLPTDISYPTDALPDGNANRYTGTSRNDVTAVDSDLTLPRAVYGFRVKPYVYFDNGTEKSVALAATWTFRSQNGSFNPLNTATNANKESLPTEEVRLTLWGSHPGETTTIEATDPVTGVKGTFLATTRGTLPVQIAHTDPGLQSKSLLPAKSNDPVCAGAMALSPFAGGSGTQADPYLICSAAQLEAMATVVRKYNPYFYKLLANLDLSAESNRLPVRMQSVFKFDGNGYTISNMAIVDAENSEALFTPNNVSVDGSSISNLNLTNSTVRGLSAAPLFAGAAAVDLTNVHIDSAYIEGQQIAGLALTEGLASNVGTTNVSLQSTPTSIPEIWGATNSRIVDCYVTGKIQGAPSSSIAGAGQRVDRCLVNLNIRSGVQSRIRGLSLYEVTNSKVQVDLIAPSSSVAAFTANATNEAAYSVNGHTVTVANNEFSGTVDTGSDLSGGTFAAVTYCDFCRVSGNVVKGTINARSIGGLAFSSVGAWMTGNAVDLSINGVPADASVGLAFVNRTGVGKDAVFTYLNANTVNLHRSAPAIFADVTGQALQTIPGVN